MYLELRDMKKSYGETGNRTEVLRGISFEMDRGEICVLLGPSGSGKSTLLNIIGGIEVPDILLCDEPTGALDYGTSKEILTLIERVNQKYGSTVILVTHNDAIREMADHVIILRDGQIREEYRNDSKTPAAELDW